MRDLSLELLDAASVAEELVDPNVPGWSSLMVLPPASATPSAARLAARAASRSLRTQRTSRFHRPGSCSLICSGRDVARIHASASCAARRYAIDGVFVTSCPETYADQIADRICGGRMRQCSPHPHSAGGTSRLASGPVAVVLHRPPLRLNGIT